jgi:hypothetical protein
MKTNNHDYKELSPKPGWCGNFVPNGKSLGKSGPMPAFSGKFKAYIFKDIAPGEEIVLDFDGIKVMTPSWLDEFTTGMSYLALQGEVSGFSTKNLSMDRKLSIPRGLIPRQLCGGKKSP